MSYILHIDTSGKEGLVAIASDGEVLAVAKNENTRDHAASINLMVNTVLAEAGIALQDIDAIAVCAGPGSYTGLRIGLATAKGYCYALNKPLLMDNKLTLLAYQVYDMIKNDPSLPGTDKIISVLTAREKEYFFSSYNKSFNVTVSPTHILENELLSIFNTNTANTYLIGVLPKSILENLNGKFVHIDNEQVNINIWAKYALEAYKSQKIVSLSEAEPFYLKQVHINKKL